MLHTYSRQFGCMTKLGRRVGPVFFRKGAGFAGGENHVGLPFSGRRAHYEVNMIAFFTLWSRARKVDNSNTTMHGLSVVVV